MGPARLLWGLAALVVASPAFAADPPDDSEVVVTATRLPEPLSATPDAHVIDSRQIQQRQASFVYDLLSDVPGVEISRTGAFGGISSVKIRGASSDKTLVLIDGAPVNDPTSPAGGFDFSSLDTADVDRIEVLSGPQGSLWGSDAIGGVVSITTREPAGLRASGELGAFGTERATAEAGLVRDGGALGASVGWFSTGGISKADARDGNPERDPFDSFTAQLNARLSPADWISLDGRVRYNRANVDLDSSGGPTGVIDGPDTQHSRTWTGFVQARIKGPFGFQQELRADGMDLDRLSDSFFGGVGFPFEAKGRRLDLRWTADKPHLGGSDVLVGVERESSSEDTGDGGQSARNWAAFAVWTFKPSSRLSTTVSLRRDAPRDFKGVTTGRASAVLGLAAGFSLEGDAGQGFKAPSIFERTYPCFECVPPGPAPDLRPERATGWDAGLGWRGLGGRVTARLTAYGLSVRDQIDYIYPRGYLNIARTRTTGVEAEVNASLPGGFWVQGAYAYADARDATTHALLLRVPLNTGSAGLGWSGPRADITASLRAQSRAADVYGEIRPFAVVDLAGSYAITRNLRLTARIENLFDTHYQQAFGYGEPGFGAFVGIRINTP